MPSFNIATLYLYPPIIWKSGEVVNHLPFILLAVTYALDPFLRITGGVVQVVPLIILAIYVSIFCETRRVPGGKLLIAFSMLSILYAVASAADVLPNPWAYRRDHTLIMRQAYPFVAFPLIVILFSKFWNYEVDRGLLKNHCLILVAMYPAIVLIDRIVNVNERGVAPYGFANTNAIFLTALSILALRHWRARYRWVTAGIVASSFALQNIIASGIFVLSAYKAARPARTAIVVLLCVFAVIAASLPDAIFNIDGNSAIRGVFIRDALSEWARNGLVGHGFGVPSLKSVTVTHITNFNFVDPDELFNNKFYNIGVHNSFVGTLFRMGPLALGLLIAIQARAFRISGSGLGLVLSSWCFVSLFSNVAIESAATMLGTSFMLSASLCAQLVASKDAALFGAPAPSTRAVVAGVA